jgi:transketolase
MHIAEVDKQNNLGSTGIVGGNQPPAVGAALAEKYKKTGKVVLSFFGDGSTNCGSFHESMNMASTLAVPLVAIIENNLYGMSVPFSVAVFLAVRSAAKTAREDMQMTLLEAKTYRWYGHSRSDPRAYRTKAEEKAWHDRDPITVLSKKLLDEKLATQQELDTIKDKAFNTIETATKFALDSPWPNPADVANDVYVDETYPSELIKSEKLAADKAMEATAAFESAFASSTAKTKKAKTEESKGQIKSQFGMDIMTMAQSIIAAQDEELARDENVILMGEDVTQPPACWKNTERKGSSIPQYPKRLSPAAQSAQPFAV